MEAARLAAQTASSSSSSSSSSSLASSMPSSPEIRRRITYLMLFRVVLITLVFVTTILLGRASPGLLADASSIALFAVVGLTYALTLIYALVLPRVANPIRFADAQIAGDLLITTVLVHITGGAESGYSFFYPLSIIGAAVVRYRRGPWLVVLSSVLLYVGVSALGWMRWLPTPLGQRVLPWQLADWELIRRLVLNGGAFIAVGALAAFLGQQLAHAGESLERQQERSADLATLNASIVRSLSSGLITVDREGRILTLNHSAGEILDLVRREVIGRPLAEHLPDIHALLQRSRLEDVVRREEIKVRHSGGQQLILGISVSPLVEHRGELLGRIVNFQDLTDLRRMEVQVSRAQRLAVVGELAAGVAHEIRNPLAAISGSIELLRRIPQVDEDSRALMDIALREVARLDVLITDLLDYARPRERILVDMDLVTLVEETVRVFSQDKAAGAIRIIWEPGLPTAALQADGAQLRQVVWNLLRNAAEAMAEGGEIRLRVREVMEDGRSFLELAVADTGTGISLEDQERIFTPFFTTKHEGSGIGLATVHRIVTEHGGSIGVESELGRGTRFLVRLPLR